MFAAAPSPFPSRRTRRAAVVRAIVVSAVVLGAVSEGRAQTVNAARSPVPPTIEVMRAKAAVGDAEAQHDLAGILEFGAAGVPADTRQAVSLYCRAARKGRGEAAYRLSRLYMFGRGVPIDGHMSIAWLRVSAELGWPAALRLMSLLPRREAVVPAACGVGVLQPVRYRTPPAAVTAMVRRMAPDFGLDPDLVAAVIEVESAWRADSVSSKDAAGLMQLMPETARRFGVENVFDPADNLRGGMRYLRWLLSYFRGDLSLVLAAYNAGEGAVERHGGLPPFTETVDYVRKVRRLYPVDEHPFDATLSRPSRLASLGGVDRRR